MGDIGMLKGGLLAWLLWQGGVIGDVVVLSRINVGLGVTVPTEATGRPEVDRR